MAVTYSSTLLARYRSILSNSLVSIASTASEVVTLVHQLGASPHEIRISLRSQTTNISGNPLFTVQSWNASQAIIGWAKAPVGAAGAGAINVDIIAEFTHSIMQ